jgi:hypothetical protein
VRAHRAAEIRDQMMNDDIREIRCDEWTDMDEEFPLKMSVVREMLPDIDELCI